MKYVYRKILEAPGANRFLVQIWYNFTKQNEPYLTHIQVFDLFSNDLIGECVADYKGEEISIQARFAAAMILTQDCVLDQHY